MLARRERTALSQKQRLAMLAQQHQPAAKGRQLAPRAGARMQGSSRQLQMHLMSLQQPRQQSQRQLLSLLQRPCQHRCRKLRL